jgi:23S rRNA (cytosine1962-C5)-methyltransferase
VDRYDSTLVLKIYTAAWLSRLDEIVSIIDGQIPSKRVVLRLSRNIQSDFEDGQILRGTNPDKPVVFMENGIRFEADVLKGQKTGFFLDQRENRKTIETLAEGCHVLNAFSFSGGFSLYAARGGALSVTDLDISAYALESAKRNFAVNQSGRVKKCPHQTIQADVFEWLRDESNQFDLIILDPPSLARKELEREGAIEAYGRLVKRGIARLKEGGILFAGSCSAHVSAEEFFGVVRDVAGKSRRKFEELRTTGHPPDHPASFREAHYLNGIYIKLD